MSELRRARVESAIELEVSTYIRTLDDPLFKDLMITHVEVSHDLHYAKIYFTVFGKEEEAEKVMRELGKATRRIQRDVARRLRNMRNVPLLSFHFDTSIQQGDKVIKLLEEIKKELDERTGNEEN